MSPPARCDLAVVGGGIIGLAVARELAARRPGLSICVIEREREVGAHQTGHSSDVIHSGVYYEPGSLKARLCVAGARELYEYCELRGIPHERCGKLILAVAEHERPRLVELARRAEANAVPGVRMLGTAREIEEHEPHARGVAALHCASTGITDFRLIARALAEDLRAAGATIALGCEVIGAAAGARSLRIEHSLGVTDAGFAVFCAGAWSDRLARTAGAGADPRIVPFRGAYLRLTPARRGLVRALVYPVPDPRLPFLGVHLTRRLDGEVLIGPTALLAPSRDAYSLRTLRPRDLAETLTWPGTPRMFARWWRTGVEEIARAGSRARLASAAARLVPEIRADDVLPSFAGVRAQALGRDGRLLDDFAFSATPRALHVRNAPSPAATSALAIARHVADRADRGLG